MGCGTSSYPVDSTADEDPNKNTKLVERFNYKEHQESKDAVPQMQKKVVQNKQVPRQPQEKLDISETSHQTEHEQSGDEFASDKIQKDKNILAAAKDESNKSNKASSTEEVRNPQVKPSQGDSCTDANYTPTVISQNDNGDSVENNRDVSQSNTDPEDLETPHNEPADLTLIQATAAKSSDQDININKNTSIDDKISQEEKELTLKKSAQDEMNVCVIQSVSTPSDKEIDGSPGTPEKSKQKIAPTNGAAETAAEMSAFLVAGDCHAAENQLDPVCEVGDQQLGTGVNANQEEIMNEMALDQGQVSQTSCTVAGDLDQTVNLNLNQNQNQDELRQESTDETIVEVGGEKSSDGCKRSPDVMTETTSRQPDQIDAHEKSSESTLNSTSPEQQTNSHENNESAEGSQPQMKNSGSSVTVASPHQQQTSLSENYESIEAIPCGEESHPKVKNPDSTISVTNVVKNNKTENIELFPSRDKNAENRLIKALRLSCKLSPGHLVQGLDVRGVMSIHLMRSLSPGVLTVAELVRKLVHLTELDLSGNLLGPQGFRVICLALRRNTTLKCLNLANNLADTDSSECIGLMLSANSTLQSLDVSGNNLGSDYFSRCVGPALRTNKSLKALKFSSCASSDVSAICEAMAEDNVTIEELDASNNHIGAVFGEGLLKILQKPGCCLRHIDIHGTNLGKEGMASLLTGIQQNRSLVSLNAAGHQVPCLSFLMEFLYSCICHPTLQDLILENTKVVERDEWQPQGVPVSEASSNLTKLQLSGCSLTNQALQTLSEKTQGKLSYLTHLELSSNDQLTTECLSSVYTMISSPGQSCALSVLDFSLNAADSIAVDIEKLPELRNLKSLLLKKCRIAPTSIADLSKLITMATPDFLPISSLTLDGIKLSGTDALKGMLGLSDLFIPTNPCRLELLSLVGCGLNDRDVKPLMSAICNGVVIKELRLSANRLTDTAVNYLVDSCGTSLSLQALDLSINKIRNGGAEKLAEALSDKLVNLQSLLLADNCIGKAGILALVSKIGQASQLSVLNLKSQQQAIGEEDIDEIMEQLAKSIGLDLENSMACAQVFNLSANFTINLTGLGGEPGELGPKLDSQAILTDYSAKHRRTLTLEDALQLSAVLSHSEDTRGKMSQSDWDRVISADKDAPTWLQLTSQRENAVYISNLPLSVTAEKLEGQLDSEAECNVMEVYLLKDQILRKPNGLAWVLFTDTESVQRAVEYYSSGQAFMYGTPFVISSVTVDVIADTGAEDEAETRARQEMIQRAEDRKADQTAHAQLVQSNYDESLARHEYAAQHPAYADGRVW